MAVEPVVTIRSAVESDVATIVGFIRELAEFEELTHEVVIEADDLSSALFAPNPVAEAVIVEIEGDAVGFALFFRSFSTFLGRPGLYLEDLYVKPRFRGRGVGKALLTYLARTATERGYGRIEWAVLDWNQRAIAFYERIGATPLAEWATYRLTGQALSDAARR